MEDQGPDRPGSGKLARLSKLPPALTHGAFSALTILPGEDRNEFIKLYKAIEAEFVPDGPIERQAVVTIAVCQWRASHLTIFRRAKRARAKYGHFRLSESKIPAGSLIWTEVRNLLEETAKCKQAGNILCDDANALGPGWLDPVALGLLTKDETKIITDFAADWKIDLAELLADANDDYQLALLGDVAREEQLEKELAILERLEARISRAMKTLIQTKTMKEILGTDPKSRPKSRAKSRAICTQLDTAKKTES